MSASDLSEMTALKIILIYLRISMKLSKFKKNKTKFKEISAKTKPQLSENETKTMPILTKRVPRARKFFIGTK
jgi:hypothetical protein